MTFGNLTYICAICSLDTLENKRPEDVDKLSAELHNELISLVSGEAKITVRSVP